MYVHGSNLEQKETHPSKYRDELSRKYLKQIRPVYDKWKADNLALKGPFEKPSAMDRKIISARVSLLNKYKDFLDVQHYAEQFDSRSNLHSSVLEEFMYYLFRDMVSSLSKHALLGKSHTFKDIFFKADSYQDMLKQPSTFIEKKDHDFAIGVSIDAKFRSKGQTTDVTETWDLPAAAIECKTYLDKTMLQDASTAAEQLKHRTPSALYIVVAEWLKLTEAVNLRKFKIDQIYVLRKQKNTDREFRYEAGYAKNPIYEDVVWHLFSTVRDFLTTSWEGGINFGLTKGFLISDRLSDPKLNAGTAKPTGESLNEDPDSGNGFSAL